MQTASGCAQLFKCGEGLANTSKRTRDLHHTHLVQAMPAATRGTVKVSPPKGVRPLAPAFMQQQQQRQLRLQCTAPNQQNARHQIAEVIEVNVVAILQVGPACAAQPAQAVAHVRPYPAPLVRALRPCRNRSAPDAPTSSRQQSLPWSRCRARG